MKRCLGMSVLLLALVGCQSRNRFESYGCRILLYEGRPEVLANCCSSSMALLANDLQQEKQLDRTPGIDMSGKSISKDDGLLAVRHTYQLGEPGWLYRIETVWISGQATMVLLDYPDDDSRLIDHLMQRFSSFDVRGTIY